jgi:hypothetical protein
MNPSTRIVQPIRYGRAYFQMVTRSSFSTGSRIPFRSNFKLLLRLLLSSLSLPLSIFSSDVSFGQWLESQAVLQAPHITFSTS